MAHARPNPAVEVKLDGEGYPIDDQPLVQRAIDQWPLALVLIGLGTGLAVLTLDDFVVGAIIMAASVLFAGLLRTVLSHERAGLLAIRRRSIDLLTIYALGAALLTLALVVPPPK